MKPHEVRIMRAHFELSQAEMATLVGVTLRGWRRWELGERKMPVPTQRLVRLAMADPGAYRALRRMAKLDR